MDIALQIWHGITLIATIFLIWGIVKATRAGNPKRTKDRVYLVKTSYVLFFGSILWLMAGLVPLVVGSTLVWTHFAFATGLGWKCYVFHKDAKALPRQ